MARGGHDGGSKKHAKTMSSTAVKKPLHHHRKQLNQQLVSIISTTINSAHSFFLHNDLHLLPSQSLTLESLLSSLSLSLSSLISFLPKPLSLPQLLPPPPQCWFNRFLSATPSSVDGGDPRWNLTFRMSRSSFSLLLNRLSPILISSIPSAPPAFSLAAALYRLAHAASYKAVAHRFGLSSSEACRAFYIVCKAVNDELGHLFELRSDKERIVVGFGWISLPNCCGVLGFTKFEVDGDFLGERNGSLIVQALVDSEGRFSDISAGWPGTMKIEAILHQTKFYSGVTESRDILNGPLYELNDGDSIPQYILGDSCFPLLPWLLTPYNIVSDQEKEGRGRRRRRLSLSERAFNSTHSRAMELIKTAFGRVRGRWKLLSQPWKGECVEFLPSVVVAGCLLHNFLISCCCEEEENVECVKQEMEVSDGDEVEEEEVRGEEEEDESEQRIRDVIALHLSKVSLRR